MLIYSGVRISELLVLKKSDVHLDENWFNKNDCEYLLSTLEGEHFLYRNYYDSYWVPILKEINIDHKPHDTRHTCISLLATAKVYQTTIKKIVGHSGAQTLTERVYTHLDISELIEAINLI